MPHFYRKNKVLFKVIYSKIPTSMCFYNKLNKNTIFPKNKAVQLSISYTLFKTWQNRTMNSYIYKKSIKIRLDKINYKT